MVSSRIDPYIKINTLSNYEDHCRGLYLLEIYVTINTDQFMMLCNHWT